jgi:putative DNA primase/helicase
VSSPDESSPGANAGATPQPAEAKPNDIADGANPYQGLTDLIEEARANRAAALHDYLHACYGDTEGYAVVVFTDEPYLDGDRRFGHRHREERAYRWPADAEAVEHDILEEKIPNLQGGSRSDVFICPYLMRGKRRTKWAAVTRTMAHADVDGDLDLEKVRTVGATAVGSGTHGHGHVYVTLTTPVTGPQHDALCRGLGKYLGANDTKCSDNDLLRPAGTRNFKRILPGAPGFVPSLSMYPAEVEWLVPPTERILRTPQDLARQLNVKLRSDTVRVSENGSSTVGSVGLVEPVDLADYPDVQTALDNVSGDRSGDTYGIVAACYDGGFTLEQARQVVASRADLAGRLDERGDDDVLKIWLKLDTKQRQLVRVTGGDSNAEVDNGIDTRKITHSGQVRMAYRLAKRYDGKLKHVHGIGWHYYDGKRWAADDLGKAHRAVLDVLKTALAKSVNDKDLRADVRRCESGSGIAGVLAIAAALPEFACTVNDLDADPYLLNCANGTLDLRTMELLRHNPAHRITKVARAGYHDNPDTTGAWKQFLDKVLPNEEVRNYLRRVAGVALLARVIEHVLIILTGRGFNGKSKFYEALLFALGDYAATAEPDLFMHRENAHPTGEMDLLGRRLIVVSESEEGRRLAVATMKRLTGGDRIKARRMRQDFVEFDPSHLALLVTNHLPVISGGGDSVWGRIRVIPFNVFIPEAERDHDLADKLAADADAILAWAVAGWRDYQANGLSEPRDVLVATKDYRIDSDAVARFIEDRCEMADGLMEVTQTLYEAWQDWAVAEEGLPEMSQRAFGKALDGHNYPVTCRTAAGRWRSGIALKAEDQ